MPPKKFKPTSADKPAAPAQPPKEDSMSTVGAKFYCRLRNDTMSLPCSVDQGSGKPKLRATLIPNQWTEVPEAIYTMLKNKFQLKEDISREVPDYNANERNPRLKQDESQQTITRTESKPGYIIEFKPS